MKEEKAQIVKSGTWSYDGKVMYEVWIVKQNFEYWYEEDYDETEQLNENGEKFAVLYALDGKHVAGDSEFFTLEEAVAAAERAVPQGIRWDDHRIQPLFGGRKYQISS
jgi:hypothetical protein